MICTFISTNNYFLSIFYTDNLRTFRNIFSGMTDSEKKSVNHKASRKTPECNEVRLRSEFEQHNSFQQPIYSFPKQENDKEMILKFSQKLIKSRVFFIQSMGNSLESFNTLIEDDEREYIFDDRSDAENDNEPFLNQPIQNKTEKAKRFNLKINGSSCQMLVLNNNCSNSKSLLGPLRKKLGEIIESEGVQHIINFMDLPKAKNEAENASKSQTKIKLENQCLIDQFKFSNFEKVITPTTYKTQEAIACELYKRVKAKLKKFDDIDLEKHFEDFEFIILLPNRISLEEQTIERIKKKFTKKKNPEKNVIRICPNTKLQEKWNEFLHKARKNRKTFFLVIHDECHWAAGTKGTIDFLGFDKGDYHYFNGQLLPNVFTLMVSATPYNFFPHLQPEDILYWNKHLKDIKLENTYQGLSQFREGKENCQMVSTSLEMGDWWEENQDYFAPMIQNGFTKEFILVLLEYCTSISMVADPNLTNSLTFLLTPQVKKCVQECIHQNKQIIVRLDPAFDEVRPTEVAKCVLQKVIDSHQQEVEVIVLTSSQQEQQNADAFLDNKPKIILVIEQFRMGDTFPTTCICFDLRARYLFPVHDFTSIIQDVGRAFGYPKRPLLLLSKQANDFLTDIWDLNTGPDRIYISVP
jgi:hypothetical protein